MLSICSRAPAMTSRAFWIYHLHQLILDTSRCGRCGLHEVSLLPLIPFCDPSCAGFTSSALHLSVRAFSLAYDNCSSALCVIELPNCCWKVLRNFSDVSSSDCVLSFSGSSLYSVIRLASVSVGQTTFRSWSVGTARFSFTALACFSSFLLHCQCALSDLASPARLSLGVAVELVGMT